MENPIGKKQRELIFGAERRLRDLVGLFQKCRACNIDIDDVEAAAAFLFDQIEKLKTNFVGVKNEPVTAS